MRPWDYAENIVIYLTIGVITVGGIWLTGTWYGLWSFLLLICVNTPGKKSNEDADE